jgi:hypothetical protein
MSYTSSNLYASRVYSEHPVALWAMDEPNYYVSLISENEKTVNATDWAIYNAVSSASAFTITGYPIDDSNVTKFYLDTDVPKSMSVSLTSDILYSELDPNKGSICFSTFLYIPETTFLKDVYIGFIVNGQEYYKKYSSTSDSITGVNSLLKFNNWEKISYTRDISVDDDFKPFIRIEFDSEADAGEVDTSVYINGISVGQWSESYNSVSTGAQLINLPEEIESLIDFPLQVKGTQLDPYGVSNVDVGFVTSFNNSLFAKLSGIPMVYGSSGNIRLNKDGVVFVEFIDGSSIEPLSIDGGSSFTTAYVEAIDGGGSSEYFYLTEDQYYNFPALVFPGKGFLNQYGYNKTLTAEFWLRISPEETSKRRIFGPLTSKDGIYVDRDFITVVVGNYTKSYFIGKWYRPMLVHFCQSENEIFLMINGEKVISIPTESLDIENFPTVEEDYLGFYTTQNIYIFELDSFSIFPYIVAEQVAKKRYVFGQGVQEQENIIGSLNGTLSYVDFPFSGYNSTIRYPDRTKWSDAFYNNIVASSEGITLPTYNIPEIIFNNTTSISEYEKTLAYSDFYKENYDIQDEEYPFICMDPTDSYTLDDDTYGTLYFSKLNQTNYQTKSIHSILKSSYDVNDRQSILYISNNFNTDDFEVFIESGSLQYKFNNTILKIQSIGAESYFSVGIDIDKISRTYPEILGSFFARPDILSLNFAGRNKDTFLGKIFSLTINNDFFTDKDGGIIFDSSGFSFKTFNNSLYNYVGAYTLLPKIGNSEIFLDAASLGYWETSIPLSYFGKYITQADGNLKYDLDLVQFNIDSPVSIFSKSNESSSNFQNYLSTKTYITLQPISKLGNFVYSDYSNVEVIGLDRVLDLGLTEYDFSNTKFQVNDGTVIYPPKDVSGFTNYYITVHIEITSRGVNTENVKIKNMSLSSLAFDEGQFYSINSPAAGKFYPIVKNQDQYVYKKSVPVVIDNESSPYLYLSGDSGISVLPQNEGSLLKGISVPINQDFKNDQEMVGIQMFLMYNEDSTFTEKKYIGRIFNEDKTFDIVLVPEQDQKRAFFKIYNESGEEFLLAKFFLNGKLVDNIVIEPFIWNCIAISLQENSIALDGILGQIEIYSGVRVDSVASFIELNPTKQPLIDYDEWNQLDDPIPPSASATVWEYWSASSTWTEALDQRSLNVTVLSLDGESIFNTYAGLSSGVANDNSIISVSYDSVVILNDISWDTYLV